MRIEARIFELLTLFFFIVVGGIVVVAMAAGLVFEYHVGPEQH